MIIRDILNMKGGQIFSIAPDGRVADAVQMMVRHDIGSLVVLDAQRTMVVRAGTPGEVDCAAALRPSAVTAGCTVAVDLLGDAVLWFALVEASPNDTASAVVLAGVVELIGATQVRLANDWLVNRSTTVVRSCADDTASLKDFVSTYADKATSSFDLTSQKLVKVTCGAPGGA